MGIGIALQTETGANLELITDDSNLLHRLLPEPNEDSDSMLAWIDRYGTTMFNHYQMRRFLEEWDRLAQRAQTPDDKELVASVRKLAERCQNEETSYLRFIGD